MNSYAQDKCSLYSSRCYITTIKTLVLIIIASLTSSAFAETVTKPLVEVTTKKLSQIALPQQRSVPATVISLHQPMLSSQLSTKVIKIHVDVGDKVEKGGVLIDLDCRDFTNAKQQARAGYLARKAQLAFAEKTYKRNKLLAENGTLPKNASDQAESEYLALQADVTSLKSQIESAELNIERCKIKSPVTGQVITRPVQDGQMVAISSQLIEILQTSDLLISADVTSTELKSLKQVKQASFKANGESTTATLYKVVNNIESATRTQEVRFKPEQDSLLVTGAAGRIHWQSDQIQIPASYLSRRDGKLGVLILNSNKSKNTVEFVPIDHAQEGQPAVVTLPAETMIVDKGRLVVQANQQVNIK